MLSLFEQVIFECDMYKQMQGAVAVLYECSSR